jgi:hypothetical protein
MNEVARASLIRLAMVFAFSSLIAASGCAPGGYGRTDGSTVQIDADSMPRPGRAAGVEASSDRERAQALLQKALTGLGGAAEVDGLRTLVLKGTLRQRSDAGALALPITTTFAYPDQMRRDVTLGNGTTMSSVFAQDDAFLLGSFGAVDYPPEEKAVLEANVRTNPLGLLKARNDPTFQVVASGSGATPSGNVDVLRIQLRGRIVHLEIDDAGRIVELIAEGRTARGERVPGGTRVHYSDFRSVAGLVYPFVSEGVAGDGQGYSIRLDAVLPNESVPPSLFERPAASGKTPRSRPP